MGSNPLLSAGKTKLFGGGCLDINPRPFDPQILTDVAAHSLDMRCHFRCLGNNGAVNIGWQQAALMQQRHDMTQQLPAINTGIAVIGIGKVPADITQPCSP